jgi:long-chain fatty acid transport protein
MVSLLGLLLLLPGAAGATPPDTFGFGSRPISLGGAVTADIEDGHANYYNPAGLARGDAIRLEVSYAASRQEHRINGVDSDLEPVRGTNVALAVPARFGDVTFAFGLGLHLDDQRISRTRSSLNNHPRWDLYDTRPHRVWLSSAVALRPVEWLFLGGGITFQSPSTLDLTLRGEAHAIRPEVLSRLEHQFEGDLRAIRYAVAGFQVEPLEGLSFGATYRGEYELRNTVRADVRGVITGFGDAGIPLGFALESITVSTFGPQQVALGAAFRRGPVRVGFDLTWLDWSKYSSPVAGETVDLDIAVPPELQDTIMVPDQITGRLPTPLNLHDRWVPRIGVEVTALDTDAVELAFRGGYFFERSPFPEQRGMTSFLDSDRHGFAAGAGIRLTDLRPTLPGWLALDVHFQAALLPEREHRRDSLVDAVGDLTTRGHQIAGGASLEVAFE